MRPSEPEVNSIPIQIHPINNNFKDLSSIQIPLRDNSLFPNPRNTPTLRQVPEGNPCYNNVVDWHNHSIPEVVNLNKHKLVNSKGLNSNLVEKGTNNNKVNSKANSSNHRIHVVVCHHKIEEAPWHNQRIEEDNNKDNSFKVNSFSHRTHEAGWGYLRMLNKRIEVYSHHKDKCRTFNLNNKGIEAVGSQCKAKLKIPRMQGNNNKRRIKETKSN